MANERVAANFQVIGASLADVDPEIGAFTDAAIDTVEDSYIDTDNYILIYLKLDCTHSDGTHEFRLKMKEHVNPQDATGISAVKTRIKATIGAFITGVMNTISENTYSTTTLVQGSGRIAYWYNPA